MEVLAKSMINTKHFRRK